METSAVIGLCVMFFLLGRAYQKWSDGTLDAEDEIYDEGYDEGHRDGLREGWSQGWVQRRQLDQASNRRQA